MGLARAVKAAVAALEMAAVALAAVAVLAMAVEEEDAVVEAATARVQVAATMAEMWKAVAMTTAAAMPMEARAEARLSSPTRQRCPG